LRTDLVGAAPGAGHRGATSRADRLKDELTDLDAEVRTTERALDRYLTALEIGSMPEEQ
jgi:hypothetical protein